MENQVARPRVDQPCRLYVAVREARDVLYALSMHIHYLACGVKSPKRLGAKMPVEGPKVID
jgi:hypothetical protein